MSDQPSQSQASSVDLRALVAARVCTSAVFMTYPACLNVLLTEWEMTATEGGAIQGAFMAAFAVSLLLSSFLCDRVGAKRVFNWATLLSAITALLFAGFARSFESGLLFVSLMGIFQGGTYTPAIMLVSANTRESKRGAAVGWVLAGMSAGYVVSISLAAPLTDLFDYRVAFAATGGITVLGWVMGHIATRRARNAATPAPTGQRSRAPIANRRSVLLTIGYIGHSWELLGVWAWIPAFLAAAILSRGTLSGAELGLWTALCLHVSGFFSSFLSGYAADRFGARPVLIGFALLGAASALSIGWMTEASVPVLFAMAFIVGFASIGDSSVLSSQMTNAVPEDRLGRALGIRSILGIGSGSVSPVVFGITLDTVSVDQAWGWAFATLALGGMLAALCAMLLKR